jgi:hypothetical protein
MIQLFGIIILFIIFTVIFVVFRVLLVARQLFSGRSRQNEEGNTGYNKPKQEYDEASVKAKRFDKSKAEDVEFEVIKE